MSTDLLRKCPFLPFFVHLLKYFNWNWLPHSTLSNDTAGYLGKFKEIRQNQRDFVKGKK